MNFSIPMEETLVEPPKPQEEDLLLSPLSSSQDSSGLAAKLDPGGPVRRQETTKKKVAYPFTVVKPGGLEGDVTLADINERMLMRPTRPVKHPVGKFAFRPRVRGEGPGLSGKAVVGLTRIHTQGRGTITIIRTRG